MPVCVCGACVRACMRTMNSYRVLCTQQKRCLPAPRSKQQRLGTRTCRFIPTESNRSTPMKRAMRHRRPGQVQSALLAHQSCTHQDLLHPSASSQALWLTSKPTVEDNSAAPHPTPKKQSAHTVTPEASVHKCVN